jgi:methionine sulfoxide reductase heme-binding subunit
VRAAAPGGPGTRDPTGAAHVATIASARSAYGETAQQSDAADTVVAVPSSNQVTPEPISALVPAKTKHKYYRPGYLELGVAVGLALILNVAGVVLYNTTKVMSYWTIARVAGFAVYVLLSLGSAVGIFLSLKWRPYQGAWLVAERLHPLLLLAAGIAATVHIGGLLLINFPVLQTFIPFISTFRNVWLGMGIVSMYLGIALFLSANFVGFIGFRVWRFLHYSAFLVWILALAHGLAIGHDSGSSAAMAIYLGGAILVGGLLTLRISSHIVMLRQPLSPARA